MRDDVLSTVVWFFVALLHVAVLLWMVLNPVQQAQLNIGTVGLQMVGLNLSAAGVENRQSSSSPKVKPQTKLKPKEKTQPKKIIPVQVKQKADMRQLEEQVEQPIPEPKTEPEAIEPTTENRSNNEGQQKSNSFDSVAKAGGAGGSNQGGAAGAGDVSATHVGGALNNPMPPYPELSKINDEEGIVVMEVVVEPSGLPSQVHVKLSSGFVRLDRSAKKAVERYRFNPATRNGRAVRSDYVFNIRFTLSD